VPDDDESHPELDGYEPYEERPLRSRRFTTMMRVVVVLGLAGLILPGILVTLGTAQGTAQRTCAIYAQVYAPGAVGSAARFELFSAAPGWNCYAVGFDGDEVMLRSLGLIPGGPRLPLAPVENS